MKPSGAEQVKGQDDLNKAKRDVTAYRSVQPHTTSACSSFLSLHLANTEMCKLITDAESLDVISTPKVLISQRRRPNAQGHFVNEGAPLNGKTQDKTRVYSDSESSPSLNAEKTKKKSLRSRFQPLHSAHKDKLDGGCAWLTDEFFPEERVERKFVAVMPYPVTPPLTHPLKVIIECQKRKDYEESVRWHLDTIDPWASDDPSLPSVSDFFHTLPERIANAPLESVISAARVVANDESLWSGGPAWTVMSARSSSKLVILPSLPAALEPPNCATQHTFSWESYVLTALTADSLTPSLTMTTVDDTFSRARDAVAVLNDSGIPIRLSVSLIPPPEYHRPAPNQEIPMDATAPDPFDADPNITQPSLARDIPPIHNGVITMHITSIQTLQRALESVTTFHDVFPVADGAALQPGPVINLEAQEKEQNEDDLGLD
ncbi:hypothetical protein B0H12DRAFT_1245528 [Mycena haematopus]|nr:hypothetical protein B0H12DRAFT_1245528 [Mycena haematopus]